MEIEEIKGEIVVTNSFKKFIKKQIFYKYSNLKNDFLKDLDLGFTKINSGTFSGKIWYVKPHEENIVAGILTKDEIGFSGELMELIPDLIFYTL